MLRPACFLVWTILSLLILVVLISPFVVSRDILFSVSAACQIRNHGHEPCCMCGMTKAFIAITEGNIREAMMHNRRSVLLFGTMLGNELLFAGFFMLELNKNIRTRRIDGDRMARDSLRGTQKCN